MYKQAFSLLDMLNNGVSKKEAAAKLGVSRVTIYNYLERLRREGLTEKHVPNLDALRLTAAYILIRGPLPKKIPLMISVLRNYGLVAIYHTLAPWIMHLYKLYIPSSQRVYENLRAKLKGFRDKGYMESYSVSYYPYSYLVIPVYSRNEYVAARLPETGVIDPYDYIIFKNIARGTTSVQDISRKEVMRETITRYHYTMHVENRLVKKLYTLAKPINSIIVVSVKGGKPPLEQFSPLDDYVEPLIPYGEEVNGIHVMVLEANTIVEKVFSLMDREDVVDLEYYPVRLVEEYQWSLGKRVEQQYYALLVKNR